MKKKSKENIMKITLVIVIITSVFVMMNNYKKNQPLESIKVDERKIKKETYAMYKENSNGEYIPYESNEFPNNELYELNISKSYCVDRNENRIDNIITLENNKPKVSSDKTVYCYLYYDKYKYTVVFNSNGGSGSMSDQVFYVGEEMPLDTNKYTNGTKKFLGWSTGSGNQLLYYSAAERNSTNDNYLSNDWVEFMQYGVDLKPYIDTYGLRYYSIMNDIRSSNITNTNKITIYLQNGYSSYYFFYETFNVTTSYQTLIARVYPTNGTASETKAMLAYFGTYGTGNYPIVKNVYFFLGKFYRNNEKVLNMSENNGDVINLYAVWQ